MNRQLPDCHWNLPEIEEAKFNANPGLFLSANQQPVSRLQRLQLPLGIRTIKPHPSKDHGSLRLFYARKFGNTHTWSNCKNFPTYTMEITYTQLPTLNLVCILSMLREGTG